MKTREKRQIKLLKFLNKLPYLEKITKQNMPNCLKKRKKILTRISDEAMYESVDITMKMRKTYKCDKG